MLKSIKQSIENDFFKPTLLSFFVNSSYIIRSALRTNMKKHSQYIKGIVLDFGCGSKPYRSLIECDKYIGIDIKTSGHDNANNSVDVRWDGQKIPFDNNYFDNIISNQVFEHVFNLEDILVELNRVLKKGGYLYFDCPFVRQEHEIPYDYARYTQFALQHLLKKYGFEIVSFRKSDTMWQALLQQFCIFWSFTITVPNKYLNIFLKVFLVLPVIVMCNILAFLPFTYNALYSMNIVLAQKVHEHDH